MAYLLQCSYMPGDTFGVSAALALIPDLTLILVIDRNLADNKDSQIRGFYTECGQQGRVRELDITNFKAPTKRIWREFHTSSDTRSVPAAVTWEGNYNDAVAVAKKNDVQKVNMVLSHIYRDLCGNSWPAPIEEVTGWVGKQFEAGGEAALKKVAESWKMATISTNMSETLDGYIKAKKLDQLRKNVVVLWSRQSGKRGGAHIELDSSFAGIKQLAAFFCANYSVILAGDEKFKGADGKSDGKLAAIAKNLPFVTDLSNMWDDPLWKDFKVNGVNRLAQLLVYHHIAEHHNVIHIGMRSGNLEGMALLGMKTFFFEPDTCPTGDRMVAFENGGIPYCRIQLTRMPGLTARWGTKFSASKPVPASAATLQENVNPQAKKVMLAPPLNLDNSSKLEGTYKGGIPKATWTSLTDGTATGQVKADFDKARSLALRRDVKGIPLELLSWDENDDNAAPQVVIGGPVTLPAIDPTGKFYARGFTQDDLHKIAVAVARSFR